jgi:broad specificity phosphatase PhoE
MALVVFRSKAAGEIFMFAETARRIFEIIGKPEAPRGVITAEQVPEALARLTAAVEEEKAQIRAAQAQAEEAARRGEDDAEKGESAITLAQRAWPLIEMLRAAQKMKVDVTWGV